MADFKLDHDRTVKSLRKWNRSFVSNIASHQLQSPRHHLPNSRTSGCSYRPSSLRQKADFGSLDRDTPALDDPCSSTTQSFYRVYAWAHTPHAEAALQHALAA
jgi:hypothetical protein